MGLIHMRWGRDASLEEEQQPLMLLPGRAPWTEEPEWTTATS